MILQFSVVDFTWWSIVRHFPKLIEFAIEYFAPIVNSISEYCLVVVEWFKMNVSDTLVADVAYFTAIDYALFIIILSFSIGIGVYFAFFTQKLKTTEDYLVGGHKMKPLPIAISLVARCVCVRAEALALSNDDLSKKYVEFLQSIVGNFDCGHSSWNLCVRMAICAGDTNRRLYHSHRELSIFASVLSK